MVSISARSLSSVLPRAPSVVPGQATTRESHARAKRSLQSPFTDSVSSIKTELVHSRRLCVTYAVENVDVRDNELDHVEHNVSASASVSTGAAASISIESVKYENGSFHVCGTMRHPATRKTVYETLVDYDALPRVFHNVDSCTARRGEDGRIVVSQMVGWKFLIFRGAFETELEVVEDEAQRVLTFSLLRSAFMKEFVGNWEVVDDVADDGSFVRHELSVMPMVRPPQRIGNLTAKIFETQVKCVLKDLADELSLRLLAEEAE